MKLLTHHAHYGSNKIELICKLNSLSMYSSIEPLNGILQETNYGIFFRKMLESYERKNVSHHRYHGENDEEFRKIKISMFVHSMLILESR